MEEWINDDCSVINIERKIRSMLNNNRWTNLFCIGNSGHYTVYCRTLKQLKREAELHQNQQFVSCVYNEEIALKIIKECISKNADKIAEWLRSPDRIISLLHIGDTPLGIVKKKGSADFLPVFSAMVIIKKSDSPDKSRSGFYVERIVPVSEIVD